MTKEEDKESETLWGRIYQAEVATNNLKTDFEMRLAKTKAEYRTHYNGKVLKTNLALLEAIREERFDTIDKARTKIQIEIIKDYVKREMKG